MPPSRDPPSRGELLTAVGLALVTLVVFWPAPDVQFVNLDDPAYVTGNPHVTGGLTAANAWWALTTFDNANWHPLTWLSLQFDAQIFGVNAYFFRVTNVLLHVANAVLLFWVLRRLTGQPGPGALAAALFALHPLHVESVAWVSERKDVLSTLFWILTLWAYVRYAERPGVLRYLGLAAAFALGLTAKPMLVTLPCVLLLLDYWPLGRRRPGALVLEKVPLFLLSAASCVVTVLAQGRGQAVRALDLFPFPERLANALASYVTYLVQTVWPWKLAAYYPYVLLPGDPPRVGRVWPWNLAAYAPPEHLTWSDWRVWGLGLLLSGVTAAAVLQGRRRPYLLVGWLWYVGTLVPVVGLVQVGGQAHADRYTYVPLIGVFVMAAWALAELARRSTAARKLVWGGCTAALLACAGLSYVQVLYWQNSFALWAHALAATGPNAIAYDRLGAAFQDARNYARAAQEYRKAVDLNPADVEARTHLGQCLFLLGRFREAGVEFAEILQIEPDDADAHFQLGVIAGLKGRTAEAVERYGEVLRLRPDDAAAHVNLAIELTKQGQGEAALRHLAAAERSRPEVRDRPEFRAALKAAGEKQPPP